MALYNLYIDCMFILAFFLSLLYHSLCQQYPSCPGGSPLSVGNSTDPYNLHVIQLSSFLVLANSALQQAFKHYLSTGDDSRVEQIIAKGKNFYVIITVSLSAVSLVLLVMLARMGDLKFSQKDRFQRLKQEGYSSPLSAFFTLLAVALLAFTAFAAYLVPAMLSSLKMTQCRLDSLNQAFLMGSTQYGWDGVQKFSQKMQLGSILAKELVGAVSGDSFTLVESVTSFADIYISQAESLYSGIKDSYSSAQVVYNDQNASQNIALTKLIPNLTAKILAPLDSLFTTLNAALSQYDLMEKILNQSIPTINQTSLYLNQSSFLLQALKNDFRQRYINFRLKTSSYFRSAQFMLIVSQLLIGFTILGCLVSIITIRLIQAKFDFFSLRVYRVIWGCHIIVLCLNLASLLVASQMMVYAEGSCAVAEKVLNNQTLLQELVPDVKGQTGIGLMNACYANSNDFTEDTNTFEAFRQINSILFAKENIMDKYNSASIANFHEIFQSVRLNLTKYKIGYSGCYPFVDRQIKAMNKILMHDPYGQACFKHHWQFHPDNCTSNQNIIVLPKIPFRKDPALTVRDFQSYPSSCYILSSYDAYYPHVINIQEFVTLYTNFLGGDCASTLSALKSIIIPLFSAQSTKESVIQSYIQQLLSLQASLKNGSYYLLQYLTQRLPLLTEIFSEVSASTTSGFISNGNDCAIVGAMITGVYNQFCINYRAQGRQVYLMIMCNLAYSVLLILLSFLYALELQGLNEEPDQEQTQRVIFQKVKSEIISSEGSIAELESRSSKSDENK